LATSFFETVTRAANTGATTGIDLTAHTKNCNCHTCLQKVSRRPFKGSLAKRASVIGDVIHTDLAGSMPPTISGYKYVHSFINGRTRLKYIYFLKKKSDAGSALRDFIFKVDTSTIASSSPCMLTTRQSLLVVISIAASASRASSLPALRRIHRNSTDSQQTSIRFCLIAFVAFSITLAWIRLCEEKLPTTPYN
jgi:hypothetical protein